MKYFYIWIIFFCSSLFSSEVDSTSASTARRIEAHLVLKDYAVARQEAEQAIQLFPDAPAVHEAYITVLAKEGDEKSMIEAWKKYAAKFPAKSLNRDLIEKMAWGVLDKASCCSCVVTRAMSLLAASFSQGSKGVDILHAHLSDNNIVVRGLAVKLSGHLRDQKLIDEMVRLFKTEKVWSIRRDIIHSIGTMKIRPLQIDLETLIESDQTTAEEKAQAIQALVNMRDDMSRSEIERLVASNRAGLRLLATQAISHLGLTRDRDLLAKLAADYHAEVRAAALQSLGQLRPWEPLKALAAEAIQDTNPKVAISAAWLLIFEDQQSGELALSRWLRHPKQENRLMAAAALASTGKVGIPLSRKEVKNNADIYVRLNLAMGLIGQRSDLEVSGALLNEGLILKKDKWGWQEQGMFRYLTPKPAKFSESSEVSPETENQLARLEILNILAVIKDAHAHEAIKRFVSERSWAVSGAASALLLTEGDEESVEIVKKLLDDPNSKIRMQAALLLSLWSRDEQAIQFLEAGYPAADHELKGNILEGLGRIGSMRSVPFLIEAMREPSQTLRMIAAMALIQCLNH